MIILDDNLDEHDVLVSLQGWAKGKVVFVRDLRVGGVIKDEAIPRLLRIEKGSTFITTNVRDFWLRVPADRRYCILCFPLPDHRQGDIPLVLRHFFHHPGSARGPHAWARSHASRRMPFSTTKSAT